MKTRQSLDIMVSSFAGVTHALERIVDRARGISAIVTRDGRILQYSFPGDWKEEDALAYINKRDAEIICHSFLAGAVIQRGDVKFLPKKEFDALRVVDAEPYFGTLRVNYGVGSNQQFFDQAFFQNAGHKFEKKPLLWNHSDLAEFGNARPIGTVVKFIEAGPEGADFAYYLSSSEDGLRQKVRESVALGDYGFIRKVSIEGIPQKGDYTVREDGVKHFHDLSYPTGIAIVLMEGLQGSQITS